MPCRTDGVGRCWPPRGQPPCAQNSTVGSRGGFPPGGACRRQRRGGWEHAAVPGGPTRLTADSGRPAGGSLPLRARPCWVRRSAGRGGKAAGRGGDLWAFQPSRCLFGPPIVSSASQRGCCRRSAGPRCGLHGREGPGRASHPSACAHPSVRPSARPPCACRRGAGLVRSASLPGHYLPAPPAGTPHPDRAPAAVAPASLAPSGTRLRPAGTARAASRVHTQGPILPGSAQPYGKSSSTQQPPLIQAQNVPQQGTIRTLFASIIDANGREKKNHLTPRDSQLITNHM